MRIMGKTGRAILSPPLRRYRFYFDLLKRTTDNYLFIADVRANVALVSPNFVQEFDMPGEILVDIIGTWGRLLHEDDRAAFLAEMERVVEAKGETDHRIEYRVRTRKGEYVWMCCRARVGLAPDGKPELFAGVLTRMARRSEADDVTGLLNKYSFERAVRRALGACRETGTGGTILVLGLDNIKIVNETHNRTVGDRVLKRAARLIEDRLPPALTLYKLDGDEFAIVYPGAGEEEIAAIFASVQAVLSRPQEIEGHSYLCTASAGTIFYPQAGKDYLVLHKYAEAALSLAKREGKNRNCLFSKDTYNRWVRSLSLRDMLWESVERNCEGFSLFYQPQVDAATQEIIGAEALLRWQNPKGKNFSPVEFVPILEETKLIIPVGKWLLEEAVKTCKRWRELHPHFRMSINMSYEQVKDLSFKDFVTDCLARYELPPEAVVLELTESEIVADWNFVNKRFDVFRSKGISIAMDDFGTGYSSLASLKNLSCDIIKIDREFVRKILENEFDRQLVEYTVSLCHGVGIKACIEGVEREEEYELLAKRCRANSIQGYFFGRPESAENFEKKFLTAGA